MCRWESDCFALPISLDSWVQRSKRGTCQALFCFQEAVPHNMSGIFSRLYTLAYALPGFTLSSYECSPTYYSEGDCPVAGYSITLSITSHRRAGYSFFCLRGRTSRSVLCLGCRYRDAVGEAIG